MLIVEKSQKQLMDILNEVHAHQEDLGKNIARWEEPVQEAANNNVSSDEQKRREAYEMAEDISYKLDNMTKMLADTVTELNKTSPSEAADAESPMSQVILILNEHYRSLEYVEKEAKQLEMRMDRAAETLRSKSQR